MDRERKKLKKFFEEKQSHEAMKEKKRAGKLRKALRKEKGETRTRVTEDNWETLLDQHGRRKRPSLSELIAATTPDESSPESSEGEEGTAAIVMSVASGRCRVFQDGEELDCVVASDLAARQKSLLAVGDRVLVNRGEVNRVERVFPRSTVLARPDPMQPHMQRLIAANVGTVINVVSVKAPPLRPRLIDRVLIAIQRGGAQPVICVNKIDLLDEDEREAELAKLDVYRALEVPVIPCSTRTGEGLEPLRELVEGKMAAFVGHSGVGKSSILNALDSTLQLATGGLHRKRGTGRHTTSASTLYDLGGGTLLIDTPGIREFGLWNLSRETLRDYFPEFEPAAEECRFTDCTHVHEPDCEVQTRVEDGGIDAGRYDTYVRLWNDLS
jgi:ribosome biogenesis GTPase